MLPLWRLSLQGGAEDVGGNVNVVRPERRELFDYLPDVYVDNIHVLQCVAVGSPSVARRQVGQDLFSIE